MASESRYRNVPSLRFPEFENDGGWDSMNLDELSLKISDGIHTTPEYDENGEYFFVNGNNLVKGRIIINEYTKRVSKKEFEKHCRNLGTNSILLSINGTIGNLAEFNNEKIVLGKSACYININTLKVNKNFISLYLQTSIVRDYFERELTGSTIKNLSLKTVKNTIINLPDPKEQQKIAACLFSLDDLITSETEKLDSLKDHKKGLLQNLFPAEGETIPKLRFPEFENDGEWVQYELGSIISYFKGYAFKSADYTKHGRRIIRVSDMGYDYIKDEDNAIYINENDSQKYKKWVLKEQDLILTTVGSKPPVYDSLVGRSIVVKDKDNGSLLNQNAVCLRANGELDQKFLNSFFKSEEYIKFIESIIRGNANQGSIALENLFRFTLYVPSLNEQQKIASCLSSLDNQITDQSLRIEELKAHKHGLMQQMFPTTNELLA